ncbi:hypothetical protein CQW23_31455 [Capsicum baccatum]|uniref:Uncharacterized protein n=1 Tax=Capsicum baccatum TaxID=33114 RepID=A0A2G2V7N7_CAPBA|nr:hypothetical protein CQW23_31455 [Capsicum baccatum]
MNGESLVESHGRPHTGTKTLRICNDGLGADHVILIDVELTESFSNVSFIDVPKSKPKSWSPFGNIILIDDDDESNENEYSEFGADDDHCFFHDLSPSMRSCSTSKSAKELRDEIDDDLHQNSTCGAAENVGTAAKPNGIMHEPPSNMGLRQTIDGRIIKKEPIYSGNSPFAFGPHGSYLESRSIMGDASVSSFSSLTADFTNSSGTCLPLTSFSVISWHVCCKECGPSLVNNRAAYEVNYNDPVKVVTRKEVIDDVYWMITVDIVLFSPGGNLKIIERFRNSNPCGILGLEASLPSQWKIPYHP